MLTVTVLAAAVALLCVAAAFCTFFRRPKTQNAPPPGTATTPVVDQQADAPPAPANQGQQVIVYSDPSGATVAVLAGGGPGQEPLLGRPAELSLVSLSAALPHEQYDVGHWLSASAAGSPPAPGPPGAATPPEPPPWEPPPVWEPPREEARAENGEKTVSVDSSSSSCSDEDEDTVPWFMDGFSFHQDVNPF